MKKLLIYLKNKFVFLGAVTLAAVVGGTTVALVSAAIPDTNGVIHGCYKNSTGALKIVDSENSGVCANGETALNWKSESTLYGYLPMAGKNFDGIDLQNRDFRGADLSGTNFGAITKFTYSDFTGANLGGSNLSGASGYFSNTNFTNANLTGSTIAGTIEGANFSGATLIDVVMSGGPISSNFNNANMTGLYVGGAVFTGSTFLNTNLTNAYLGADFLGVDLSTAVLTGATWAVGGSICPDGTNSLDNGDTCIGHLIP